MKAPLFLAPLMLAAACVIHSGKYPGDFEPARTAMGVQASLFTSKTFLGGELLEVRDTALVLLTQDQVALVPFRGILRGTFSSTDLAIANGQLTASHPLAELRMISRFPYGIPDEALRRLLASKRQDSLVVTQP